MKKLIVLALALASCGNDDRATSKKPAHDQDTKLVELTAKKYAYEAFPQWTMAHPEKACPAKLAELDEWMNERGAKDPWGNDYVMYCGATLPPGVKGGIGVSSNGPDGKPGTADDIKSW